MVFKLSIYIFTRDLRLDDNTSLMEALKNSTQVIPIFILNPTQIDNVNKFKSNNCVQFMCESLDDLDETLIKKKSKLFLFYDYPHIIIEKLLKHDKNIEAVYMNVDYTPFAKKREDDINNVCAKYDVKFFSYEDYMLTGCDVVKKPDGSPYVKFTPYYNTAKLIKVRLPKKNKYNNYVSSNKKVPYQYNDNIHEFYTPNDQVAVRGGRTNALKILANAQQFKNYNKTHDNPNYETTHLSAYLKFNVVSIREVYFVFKKKLSSSNGLFRQLYWRDFYMSLVCHFPHVIGSPMKPNYYIKWDNNASWLKKWKEGMTGIPIVDAGMRQMNTTGWMHNRLRLIVSNFLIKILQIDWMLGEKYFAQTLVDYDVILNNSNWQWSSSTGADSQPYFRFFSPTRQSEKFDKFADFIKLWVPELKDVPAKDIHIWHETHLDYPYVNYPPPIVLDVQKQIAKTLKLYKHRQ